MTSSTDKPEPWRGVEQEAEDFDTDLHPHEGLTDLLRRAVAHGVRLAAEDVMGEANPFGELVLRIEARANAIERGEVEV